MRQITNHPTRALMKYCAWVSERVSENVLIGMLCVGMLIAAFTA